jgi:hypothetical protein
MRNLRDNFKTRQSAREYERSLAHTQSSLVKTTYKMTCASRSMTLALCNITKHYAAYYARVMQHYTYARVVKHYVASHSTLCARHAALRRITQHVKRAHYAQCYSTMWTSGLLNDGVM